MFEVKTVIGRNDDGSTKYDGAVRETATQDGAIDYALRVIGTQDVFRQNVGCLASRVARVHPDGGIDKF